MKNYILMVLLLLAVFQGFSQKKKKQDPKDIKIDSLTKATSMLTRKADSLGKSQTVYYGLYTTIKEKVLLHDFNPAKLSQIIDSIRVSRDSTTSLLAAPIAPLNDSLSRLRKENVMLKAKVDSLTVDKVDKATVVADLKELKVLLDSKILTQAEYDAKKKKLLEKWP
ncbi:SHOCT domain-containing protein [Chryseolinea serpens]|nr:SHOCT domain-containing protein [Chryseolinea serpens]